MDLPKAPDKILFVDDDPNILASFLRQLRKGFTVQTALGGEQALTMVASQGPFAVVVSDFKMPGIDGVQLLSRFKEMAPDTVRILLTGYADLETAIRAVNDGNIFRLLTKPTDSETLVRALVAGVRQYRLVTAEREILHDTLAGSIKVLTELLGLLNPDALGRSSRIKELALGIAQSMGLEPDWALETAAMLCQLGLVMVPPEALEQVMAGKELRGENLQLYDMHPMVAAELVKHIPRLEGVSRIITFQDKHYDGSGPPPSPPVAGADIPLGSRILKVALDYDLLASRLDDPQKALQRMRGRKGWYDPAPLAALADHVLRGALQQELRVGVKDLTENMVLVSDVRAKDGRMLVSRGYQVTRLLVSHLLKFQKTLGVIEPLVVKIQASADQPDSR